jgi:flagellar biosynthetic protein FliQ
MTEEMVIQIGTNALTTMVYLAGPVLLAAMAVGIVISILQAVTQINEQTLTFIPKMIAVRLAIMIGPMIDQDVIVMNSHAKQSACVRLIPMMKMMLVACLRS